MHSATTQGKIKIAVAGILQGETPSLVTESTLIFSLNETVDDYDTDSLLLLFIPFINTMHFSSSNLKEAEECAREFIEDTLSLRIIEKDNPLAAVYSRVEQGERKREDRLFLKSQITATSAHGIFWDDKSSVLKLFEYAFCRCLEVLSWILAEKRLVAEQRSSTVEPRVYKVTKEGKVNQLEERKYQIKRTDLIKRRIKPTMKLGEYATKIMEEMERRKSVPKDAEVETKKKSDEEDEAKNFRGNVQNKG